MMEERKLNLNAPLLSVRRFSKIETSSDGAKGKKVEKSQLNRRHTLPLYKSDTNSDQVTEPVAVPFNWEQIPGRAKDGSLEEEEPKATEEASVTPRIPPRKVLDVVKRHKEKTGPKVPKEASANRRIPSRRVLDVAKHHKEKPEPKVPKEASVTPKISARRMIDVLKHRVREKKSKDQNVFTTQVQANSSNEKVNELDLSKEGVKEKAGLNSDDDDVYSDALDTLSPTDAISMNCSASGLSGFDVSVVKTSGNFYTDQQTRDFMMSRFLPAAKAMALEPPQYASRKQPLVVEQSRQITKVVHGYKATPNKSQSSIIQQYSQDVEEKESEDDCNDYDDSGNISTKACGWFPRLCFKNSLCLLNPVPGIKLRAQASMSSNHDVEKLSKAAYTKSHSEIVKKLSKDAVYKQKQESGGQSPRLPEVKNKLSCGSNRFIYASDRQTMNRTSSPFRRSAGTSPLRRSGCISPYRNEAPQSPFHGGGFLGIPKEAEDFKANRLNLYKGISKSQELSSYYGTRRGSRSASPAVERTLYVDTVHKAEICSSYIKGCKSSGGQDFKTSTEKREKQEAAAAESCFQDAERRNVFEGEKELKSKVSASANTDSTSLTHISHVMGQEDMMEDKSKALVCVSASPEGNVNIDDPVNVKTSLVQAPLPPVLPKTPSESWLWRTLPSIPSQNPFSHLYRGTSFQNKWQDPKTSSSNTKWENIVKSSYLHHDHVRYSEELIPHPSQHSKS